MVDGPNLGGSVLVVNAGSSSLKLSVFGEESGETPLASARIEGIGSPEAKAALSAGGETMREADPEAGASHRSALARYLPRLSGMLDAPIVAVGHRIVHGGAAFTQATLLDESVVQALEKLIPLARSHQPHGVAGIRSVASIWPETPQVACFDTAFHATIPERARTIALPRPVREAGVRRYGFHGLSYQWLAERAPEALGAIANGRVVAAHLGNGASLCGMVDLTSRATTMGFTPLDGLVMGERPGLTDPGAILFMLEDLKMSLDDLRTTLFHQSGLLGLSGVSNDLRTLTASEDPAAQLALEVYVHRIVREIGAMAAEIGGADALVFTGGVGENAAQIRAQVIEGLAWLGFSVDPASNDTNGPLIGAAASKQIAVIAANEEAIIARDTKACALSR